jgi:branched-subunit amino acid transport protein
VEVLHVLHRLVLAPLDVALVLRFEVRTATSRASSVVVAWYTENIFATIVVGMCALWALVFFL